MEAVGRGMDACGGSQCAYANGDAHAADGNDSGAGALQESEHDAGPIEELRIEKEDPLPVRSSRRLRDFCLVLHLLGHVCCLMNFVRISVSTSCRRRRVEGG